MFCNGNLHWVILIKFLVVYKRLFEISLEENVNLIAKCSGVGASNESHSFD